MYKISRKRLLGLLEAEAQLDHLECTGVDNWSEFSRCDDIDEEDALEEFKKIEE